MKREEHRKLLLLFFSFDYTSMSRRERERERHVRREKRNQRLTNDLLSVDGTRNNQENSRMVKDIPSLIISTLFHLDIHDLLIKSLESCFFHHAIETKKNSEINDLSLRSKIARRFVTSNMNKSVENVSLSDHFSNVNTCMKRTIVNGSCLILP